MELRQWGTCYSCGTRGVSYQGTSNGGRRIAIHEMSQMHICASIVETGRAVVLDHLEYKKESLIMSARRSIAITVLLGGASAALYVALLANSDLLVDLANRTRNGEKWLFFVPVAVAFAFSYIHGAFTGHFWESIGLRASNNINTKNK